MPDNYFARYLPLLIHFLVAVALAGVIVLLSYLIGYRRPTRAKMSPYECGMTPVGDARERFSVKFYLVAMLFILFDIEAVFLYPWAVILRDLKMFGFWEMLVYIGIMLVGFFYVWKKGRSTGASLRPGEARFNAARSSHHRSGATEEPSRHREIDGLEPGFG